MWSLPRLAIASWLHRPETKVRATQALDGSKSALAQRMHRRGESATTIAAALGVSRATVYRALAEEADSSATST